MSTIVQSEGDDLGYVSLLAGPSYSRTTSGAVKLGRDENTHRAFAQFPFIGRLSDLPPDPIKAELEFTLATKSGTPTADNHVIVGAVNLGEPGGVHDVTDEQIYASAAALVEQATIPMTVGTGPRRIDLGALGLAYIAAAIDAEYDLPLGLMWHDEQSGVMWTLDRDAGVRLVVTYRTGVYVLAGRGLRGVGR